MIQSSHQICKPQISKWILTKKAAHLIDNTYDEQFYDALTLFKTTTRLNNKLQEFPGDVKTALCANISEHDDLPSENLFDDHLYTLDEQQTRCTYKMSKIDEIIKTIKDTARKVAATMKKARNQLTANRLNRRGVQASKDIFAYVREKCRAPTGAIYVKPKEKSQQWVKQFAWHP